MQSALRIGRIGPLNIHLNYTWLIATVIAIWWIALLWVPDNFPTWPGQYYWLVAIAALLLFLASVILHELVHAVFAGTTDRAVNLFPIGAAVPFGFQQLEPGKALRAAIAGPVFSLLLGVLFLFISGAITPLDGFPGGIKALLAVLGTMNALLGLVNLIPGIPFDGGWALAAGVGVFTADRESGLTLARMIGGLASLMLVLFGAYVGLTSDSWLVALALVLTGWAAREALSLGEHRTLLRGAFEQMQARHFMDKATPGISVKSTDTVADMVRNYPKLPPQTPIPVLDAEGTLVGIVSPAAADTVLQGTWPVTPVTALMTQIASVQALHPGDSLTDILTLVEARRGTPQEDTHLPVLENGNLLGGVDPARLQVFERVGQEFGIEETASTANMPTSFLARVGTILPALMVIAAMAILGSIALRTDPADLRDQTSDNAEARITFSNFVPADQNIVERGSTELSVDLQGSRAISTATFLIDGQPIETTLSGSSPLTQTAHATVSNLGLGIHDVRITASTISGRSKSEAWQFRVGDRVTAGTTPGAQTSGSITAVSRGPVAGARVLAGAEQVPIILRIAGPQAPQNAQIFLNGDPLDTKVTPSADSETEYIITATAPPLHAGVQRVTVEIQSTETEHLTADWTFMARVPDENNAYFEQTGYFITQPFLNYWRDNGGLAIFGYPISPLIQEKAQGTGEVYTAQYFERARFEQHTATGEEVILGRLGALLNKPEPAVEARKGVHFFPETGHNVSDVFFDYWQQNGGLAIFGYPISEERIEKSPADGKEYRVQYFERNRFEYHPEEEGTPFVVQLGQLGRQLYEARDKQ